VLADVFGVSVAAAAVDAAAVTAVVVVPELSTPPTTAPMIRRTANPIQLASCTLGESDRKRRHQPGPRLVSLTGALLPDPPTGSGAGHAPSGPPVHQASSATRAGKWRCVPNRVAMFRVHVRRPDGLRKSGFRARLGGSPGSAAAPKDAGNTVIPPRLVAYRVMVRAGTGEGAGADVQTSQFVSGWCAGQERDHQRAGRGGDQTTYRVGGRLTNARVVTPEGLAVHGNEELRWQGQGGRTYIGWAITAISHGIGMLVLWAC
jgi:hypothetical protein